MTLPKFKQGTIITYLGKPYRVTEVYSHHIYIKDVSTGLVTNVSTGDLITGGACVRKEILDNHAKSLEASHGQV